MKLTKIPRALQEAEEIDGTSTNLRNQSTAVSQPIGNPFGASWLMGLLWNSQHFWSFTKLIHKPNSIF
jgi:hypothetical protein